MQEILPNLYLSTYNQVKIATYDFFQVNCTKDLPMVRTEGIRIAVNDDPREANTMLVELEKVVKIFNSSVYYEDIDNDNLSDFLDMFFEELDKIEQAKFNL